MQALSNTLWSRNRSRSSVSSTPPRFYKNPPPPHSQACSTCVVLILIFFFLNSSPHFTPASPAWGLRPSWQKLEELRRENTWQTGLSFSHQTNQAQCNSHLTGNTPKEQHKQKQAFKQQEASKIEERDLALLSSGSINLLQGQIPHELIIKGLKEALKRHQHLTKRSQLKPRLPLALCGHLSLALFPVPTF